MSNIRVYRLSGADGVGTRSFTLIDDSPTGIESIFADGDFSGCTINIQTMIKTDDGTPSYAKTLSGDSTHTSGFDNNIGIGKGGSIVINATSVQADTDILFNIRQVN